MEVHMQEKPDNFENGERKSLTPSLICLLYL